MPIRKPSTSVNEALQRSGAKPFNTGAVDVLVRESAFETDDVSPVFETPPATSSVKPSIAARSALKSKSSAPSVYSRPQHTAGLLPPLKPPAVAKEHVFLSALLPAQGISLSFDRLLEYYQPHKALQMILRRAMSDYEIMLANGGYLKAPLTYGVPELPSEHVLVQTSRVMPQDLANIAREHFDPYGFESTRAFGYKLATAALATFFQSE